MQEKCQLHDILSEDIKEIKKDVKQLLEYMWMQKGRTLAISAATSIIMYGIMNIITRSIKW